MVVTDDGNGNLTFTGLVPSGPATAIFKAGEVPPVDFTPGCAILGFTRTLLDKPAPVVDMQGVTGLTTGSPVRTV